MDILGFLTPKSPTISKRSGAKLVTSEVDSNIVDDIDRKALLAVVEEGKLDNIKHFFLLEHPFTYSIRLITCTNEILQVWKYKELLITK